MKQVILAGVGSFVLGALGVAWMSESWAEDDIVYEIQVEASRMQKPKSAYQIATEQQKKREAEAKKAGEKAAEKMKQNYKILDKPNIPTAYYYYLEDLKVIAEKGLAPERANLFQDLELMNSKDVYIYYDSNDYYGYR